MKPTYLWKVVLMLLLCYSGTIPFAHGQRTTKQAIKPTSAKPTSTQQAAQAQREAQAAQAARERQERETQARQEAEERREREAQAQQEAEERREREAQAQQEAEEREEREAAAREAAERREKATQIRQEERAKVRYAKALEIRAQEREAAAQREREARAQQRIAARQQGQKALKERNVIAATNTTTAVKQPGVDRTNDSIAIFGNIKQPQYYVSDPLDPAPHVLPLNDKWVPTPWEPPVQASGATIEDDFGNTICVSSTQNINANMVPPAYLINCIEAGLKRLRHLYVCGNWSSDTFIEKYYNELYRVKAYIDQLPFTWDSSVYRNEWVFYYDALQHNINYVEEDHTLTQYQLFFDTRVHWVKGLLPQLTNDSLYNMLFVDSMLGVDPSNERLGGQAYYQRMASFNPPRVRVKLKEAVQFNSYLAYYPSLVAAQHFMNWYESSEFFNLLLRKIRHDWSQTEVAIDQQERIALANNVYYLTKAVLLMYEDLEMEALQLQADALLNQLQPER